MSPASRTATRALRLLAFALALALLTGLGAGLARAAVINPFSPRYTATDRGDVVIVGNTLLTCPTSASTCAAARNRSATGQALDNDAYSMVAVDIDGDPSTANSSSATYTPPAGGSVLWAGLYWGARSTSTARTTVRFRPPGAGAYQTVGGTLLGAFGSAGYYQAFADVTALVQAGGAGSYTVAGVQASSGTNRYAGWALVVVHRDPAAPLRQLTVYDGYARLANNARDRTVDVPLSGLTAPPVGPVNARLGVVAYDGDANRSGDTVQLSSGVSGAFTALSSAVNPAANFFTGTIARLGVRLTAKSPDYSNQLGFDAAVVDANAIIAPGATSAVVRLTAESSFHFVGLLTIALEVGEPAVTLTKSVTDLNGAPVRPGDTLQYTVTAGNTGRDGAVLTQVIDPIPAGASYVPGSLEIFSGPNAGLKTDAPGDDQANFNPLENWVVLRLGAGASATTGGRLGASGQADSASSFRFRVRVDPAADDGLVVSNQASIAYRGQTAGRDYAGSSPPGAATVQVVAFPDLIASKTRSGDFVLGQDVTYTVGVRNSGTAGPTTGTVTVVDDVPAGLAVRSAAGTSWSCTVAGQRVTCAYNGPLPVAKAETLPPVTIVGRVEPGIDPNPVNTARVDTPDDSNPANNTAVDSAQGRPDLVLTKRHTGDFVRGAERFYELVVQNVGVAQTTADVVVTDTLPSGLTPVPPEGGDWGFSWTCAIAGQTVTCRRTLTISAGGIAAAIRLPVQVARDAPNAVSNTARVDGGGEVTTTNNTATDPTTVIGFPDLVVDKSHSGAFTAGAAGAFRLVASNTGTDPTSVCASGSSAPRPSDGASARIALPAPGVWDVWWEDWLAPAGGDYDDLVVRVEVLPARP